MTSSSQAIGVFDSGIGGLSVLKQLMKHLPNEQFIYLGDTARVPYGNKSPKTIIRYSRENALHLIKKEIKLLVIACSTVSAIALEELRGLSNVPVVGMIEPGVNKTLAVSSSKRIAVLATRATIQTQIYQKAFQEAAPDAVVYPIACPLLVPLIEEGEFWLSHPATKLIVQEYLKQLQSAHVDTILLGCTHYPFLSTLIEEAMNYQVTLVDAGVACAQEIAHFLDSQGSLSTSCQEPHLYYASDPHERFHLLAQQFLDREIDCIHPYNAFD